MSRFTLIRHPSAFLPLAMSLLAISAIGAHLALHGPARQPDEGAAAHIWQLLLAGQVPVNPYFGLGWVAPVPGGGGRRL